MDKMNGSTALHVACEMLTDLSIIEILVDGGADVNPVNNDDQMPLLQIMKRRKEDPDNEGLEDIEYYLKRKGARTDWRYW